MKYFGANGEYACTEVFVADGGKYIISPHEYGRYTFKNGIYTEMGRRGNMNFVDRNTTTGHWHTRHDEWVRVTSKRTFTSSWYRRSVKKQLNEPKMIYGKANIRTFVF